MPNSQITFNLKVAAIFKDNTNELSKVKLVMDIGPEMTSQFDEKQKDFYSPNFNANQVKYLLDKVSNEVIEKVVAYVHYQDDMFLANISEKERKSLPDKSPKEKLSAI